jgi:hypothetical protein
LQGAVLVVGDKAMEQFYNETRAKELPPTLNT